MLPVLLIVNYSFSVFEEIIAVLGSILYTEERVCFFIYRPRSLTSVNTKSKYIFRISYKTFKEVLNILYSKDGYWLEFFLDDFCDPTKKPNVFYCKNYDEHILLKKKARTTILKFNSISIIELAHLFTTIINK